MAMITCVSGLVFILGTVFAIVCFSPICTITTKLIEYEYVQSSLTRVSKMGAGFGTILKFKSVLSGDYVSSDNRL